MWQYSVVSLIEKHRTQLTILIQSFNFTIMYYALFIGFNRTGSLYATPEEAKNAINKEVKGIYNVCGVKEIAGKLRVVTRETITIN